MSYKAPLADIEFALTELAGMDDLQKLPGLDHVDTDLVRDVLAQAGKFATGILAPLNAVGDREGSHLQNGRVHTPSGFAPAYRQFIAQGWNSVPFDPAWEGQGLPWALSLAIQELWNGANMAFALCPMLTQAVAEALILYGTDVQRRVFLPPLMSGQWSGTMQLTEPQAGSDTAQIRTRAERQADGTYRLRGQKLFITYGGQDFTPNIIHAVLARISGAPAGVKGLSLFLVPQYFPDAPEKENDIRILSLEHKMGIHASPTCVMAYGEREGAVAYLLGEEGRGMEAMFSLMNNARINVSMQGVGIAEAAYQQAVAYAKQRRQGRATGYDDPSPIIAHADVRRMLLTMRALTEASRGLTLTLGGMLDRGRRHPDPAERARHQGFVELLTPVAKAWATEIGVQVTSMNIQVHGGMGYIEETGAAQLYRDARIAPIYEGTNGIQANDLLRRKLMRDKGQVMHQWIAHMRRTARHDSADETSSALNAAIDALEDATHSILSHEANQDGVIMAAAFPYLMLVGAVAGGWIMAKAKEAVNSRPSAQDSFMIAKKTTADFYMQMILPETRTYHAQILNGPTAVDRFAIPHF